MGYKCSMIVSKQNGRGIDRRHAVSRTREMTPTGRAFATWISMYNNYRLHSVSTSARKEGNLATAVDVSLDRAEGRGKCRRRFASPLECDARLGYEQCCSSRGIQSY